MISKLLLTVLAITATPLMADSVAPLFRDFVGINGHTVQFKPKLYAPVCRVVRDYHPVPWDLAEDTSKLPEWPFAKNRVSWDQVYGSWRKEGLHISACLMMDEMKDKWKNLEVDAHAYAKAFAQNFGPGGKWPHVEYVEIGNEPGLYDDATFTKLFKAMATGIREGDPKLKIVTCNAETGKSDRYWKSADLFKPHADLYDVLQIHRYAIAEGWPVWRRSYPEDPKVPYLSSIAELLKWRNANAPGKPVWVSEFGWDTSTQKPDPKGEWAKWVGSTDEEQARYLVRSFLLFAEMGVDKAFVYFFNDEDKPQLHAASGLTRNFQPKPAYHSVAWMLAALENYRFARAHQQSLETGYCYEFSPEGKDAPSILAVWHPTKEDQEMKVPLLGREFIKAVQMPLKEDAAAESTPSAKSAGSITLKVGERPLFVWLKSRGEN
jgi:hypothetical protein